MERLLPGPESDIVFPGVSHPLVLADIVVYRAPMYQKSKPIGMLLKYPSSVFPPDNWGEFGLLSVMKFPPEAENA